MTPGDQPHAAPFVGPRAYRVGERLFGRDRERLELLDLLIAERIVLLYSPSGAGKTSLVQAGLVPALRNEAFAVPAVARVTFETATGIREPATNRYIFAVLLSLEEAQPKEQQLPLAELARMTLPDYLEQRWAAAPGAGGLVLILDQFEEILTIDPTDTAAKKEFFAQLGAALRNRQRWALLSMREEHVAGLDPFRSRITTRLNATFRLELLNEQQACQAMQEAAAQAGVVFTDGAARKLTDDLRRVRVQRPGGLLEEQLGPTVEPTQLQVVCLRLWNALASGKASIEEADVEALGSADTALADYYAEAVAGLGARERLVRDWIEDELITQRGLRNQILKEDAVQSRRVDAQAISALDERHLIREERRRGVSWLELAHDRLIEPIRSNNAAWREAHLTSFQRQAALWDRQGQPSHLELRGAALRAAERWAAGRSSELTPAELSFLRICRETRRRRRNRLVIPVAALALVIFAVGSFQGYQRWFDAQPWAYWTDLARGESHKLSGTPVSIGRSEEGLFRSQISVEPDVVSRLHLFVSRDHFAYDIRSLNGTTINGRFLPYGKKRQLRDGDLTTIAGAASFRFSTIEPSYLPFRRRAAPETPSLPDEVWAILIDGASRTGIPLTDSNYFLARNESGDISLANSEKSGSLLRIMRDGGEFDLETLNTSDDNRLFAMLKHEDRFYIAIEIPPGVRVSEFLKGISGAEYPSKMSFCFGPTSPQAEVQSIHGTETKVEEIRGDDNPSCTLGPFQIVIFRREDGSRRVSPGATP